MSVSVSNPRLAIGLRLGLGLDPNADTRVKKTSGDRHKGNFVFPASVSASTCFLYSCACVCVHLFSLLLRLCLCASLGFVSNVFFRVDLCYILWSVLLHHLICNAPLLEINCTIGFLLRQCFSILFEFQVIRKGCIFSPFLPFVLLFVRFCCNSPFALELHRCSKGRSISRVQTENCYYF